MNPVRNLGELRALAQPLVCAVGRAQELARHFGPTDLIELVDELEALRADVDRLEATIDTEVSFKDLEVKIRDQEATLRTVAEPQPAMKNLAALMWHFILGEDNTEPPNYRSAELSLKPAGEFREMRACIEVIKPGGKSSHAIRQELEAELESLRSAVEPVKDGEQ